MALSWGGVRCWPIGGVIFFFLCMSIILPPQHSWPSMSPRPASRHPSAKLDQPDLLRIVQLAFQHLSFDCKLWPMSASTLRRRFNTLISGCRCMGWARICKARFGIPEGRGATWLLNTTEDAEMVGRRGRWLSSRMMEIYIEKILAVQFVHKLRPHARVKDLCAVGWFGADPESTEHSCDDLVYSFPAWVT